MNPIATRCWLEPSRIPGNVGMLGADYPGYFEHGDGQGLADLLLRCVNHHAMPGLQARDSTLARPLTGDAGVARDPLLGQLQSQCLARAPLFAPEAEQASLIKLVKDLMV